MESNPPPPIWMTVTHKDGRKDVYENGKLVLSKTPEEYVREMKAAGMEVPAVLTW